LSLISKHTRLNPFFRKRGDKADGCPVFSHSTQPEKFDGHSSPTPAFWTGSEKFKLASSNFNAYQDKFKNLLKQFCHYIALISTSNRNRATLFQFFKRHHYKFDYENNRQGIHRQAV